MFKDWGKGVELPEHVTKDQVQEMIDAAMTKHNRRASLISIALGTIALVGYADGMLRILERLQ
jgi:hypothetical protein